MNWVIFEVAGAIYDEQGAVKLATNSSDVHVLKDTAVQRAVMVISAAVNAEAAATGGKGAAVLSASDFDGQIAYDLEEFCKDYGHPSMR